MRNRKLAIAVVLLLAVLAARLAWAQNQTPANDPRPSEPTPTTTAAPTTYLTGPTQTPAAGPLTFYALHDHAFTFGPGVLTLGKTISFNETLDVADHACVGLTLGGTGGCVNQNHSLSAPIASVVVIEMKKSYGMLPLRIDGKKWNFYIVSWTSGQSCAPKPGEFCDPQIVIKLIKSLQAN